MAKATGPLYIVRFKRRREGKTNYAKRLGLLKSKIPRLVVRKTNKSVIAQVIEWAENGDRTVTGVTSKALAGFGFNGKCNTPSAYLTGLLCGIKAKSKGVSRIILDVGLHTPSKGSLVFAVLKGAVDAGLQSEFSQEKLPSADRLEGKHLPSAKEFHSAKEKIMAHSPSAHPAEHSKAQEHGKTNSTEHAKKSSSA